MRDLPHVGHEEPAGLARHRPADQLEQSPGALLPGENVPWQVRRQNMHDVCLNCHNQVWIDNFYIQYDGLIELYNEKFARPAQASPNPIHPVLSPVGAGGCKNVG